jgi:hypothetical protein
MNVLNRRISKLEARLGLSAEDKALAESLRSAAEKIWEARRSYMTTEELIVEEQRSAILKEACRGHTSMAEAIWSGQRALKEFEAKRMEGKP